MTADVQASPSARGRLVMLVDNPIGGDSRVHKAAVSAAAAGWNVVVSGRGPAEVLSLPVHPLRTDRCLARIVATVNG
jgi:hypothetical protein